MSLVVPVSIPRARLITRWLVIAPNIAVALCAWSLKRALSAVLLPPIRPSSLLFVSPAWRALLWSFASTRSWATHHLISRALLHLVLTQSPLLAEPFFWEICTLYEYPISYISDYVE